MTNQKSHDLINTHPILQQVRNAEPVTWLNPRQKRMENTDIGLSKHDMLQAEALFERFRPLLKRVFPELVETDGKIESPLQEISHFKRTREEEMRINIPGTFYMKSDNELPVAGSIKARGGFYEVLKYAESLALKAEMITKDDDYSAFADDAFQRFFSEYVIGVASTGNLGLSIGIMSARLGFEVSVYMSRDAKQWKKDLLRQKGAHVYEYEGDFGDAIEKGRKETNAQPNGYFVDDEDSENLFLGYSTAASYLKKQLQEKKVTVDSDHPLFLYLPCGVGGSPGGVTFGLKHVFGDHVHCFFVEPTQSPSVLLGLETGLMGEISVQDIGLDNQTEGDGMAVGRPSGFATSINDQLVSGIYTIEDDSLYVLLAQLADEEGIYVEPSATAGLLGPEKILQTSYIKDCGFSPEKITHIAWSTGGLLVPRTDKEAFYAKGKDLWNKEK